MCQSEPQLWGGLPVAGWSPSYGVVSRPPHISDKEVRDVRIRAIAENSMKCFPSQAAVWPIILLAMASVARAQNQDPHVAYVYPAGGCIGTQTEVTVGGQHLDGVSGVHFSGGGVQATVIKHKKAFTQRQASQVREKLDEARKQLETTDEEGRTVGKRARREDIVKLALKKGLDAEKLEDFREYIKNRNDPKRQLNPQLAETVTLAVKVDVDAVPGKRDLRLKAAAGLSNALYFEVGELPEHREVEPNDITLADDTPYMPPVVLNGQIMPGDVDRFRFKANRGDQVVLAVDARKLVPYLADAVPGWFQATLTLYDSKGYEVGYSDDYTFHPDPVLFYKIPRTGFYGLEIQDSIYRGREDFVYRIALGRMPFITSIFPLGCRHGEKVTIELEGWNLSQRTLEFDSTGRHPGEFPINVRVAGLLSNSVPFVVDTLPECLDEEPNNTEQTAQVIRPPLIVNGRIDEPGDRDVFRFEGRKGGKVLIEVLARRINSPLDSFLKLTDAEGKQLMVNDDTVDRGEGLCTHHADSLLEVELPADGAYHVHLIDTQQKGGVAYGYRLRVSVRRPDFDLRVVPSAINARPGETKTITVYALRRDGFDGEISLTLNNPPPGLTLSGGPIPADKDEVELKLRVPGIPSEEPLKFAVDGTAKINGQEVVRPAVPADDTMQAFLYRHLVTTEELLVSVNKPKPKRGRR
jgi:hypothetical protein